MADSKRTRSPPPTPNPMVRYTDMSPVSPFFPATFSPPSPPLASYPPSKSSVLATLRARRSLLCIVLAAVVFIVIALNSATYYSSGYSLYPASLPYSNETSAGEIQTPPIPTIDRLKALRGVPTMKFRGMWPISFASLSCHNVFLDNLREDTKYIHSWLSAGWSAYTVDPYLEAKLMIR